MKNAIEVYYPARLYSGEIALLVGTSEGCVEDMMQMAFDRRT